MEFSNVTKNWERDLHGNVWHPSVDFVGILDVGRNNVFMMGCTIGMPGFIRGCKDYKGSVKIGDGNVFGMDVKIQVGEDGLTTIGSGNLIMNNCNIGHNTTIGDKCEIGAGTLIGGYATIWHGAKIKQGCNIRNRVSVGENAVVGMGSVVVGDIPENAKVVGVPAK